MEDIVEEFVYNHMYAHIVLVAVSIAAIIVAMGVDLVSGVSKAKRAGIARTSTGYKKTAVKAKKYFSPFAVLMMVDLICCVVVPVPAFSMLWAAFCVFCEFKSVREKSWQKEELRRAEKTMSVIIENKDDVARMVAKMLFESEMKKKENK